MSTEASGSVLKLNKPFKSPVALLLSISAVGLLQEATSKHSATARGAVYGGVEGTKRLAKLKCDKKKNTLWIALI